VLFVVGEIVLYVARNRSYSLGYKCLRKVRFNVSKFNCRLVP